MKRSINLFPPCQLRRNRVRQLTLFWAGVLFAFVVFVVMEYSLQHRRLNASKSLLQNVERKVRPVRFMVNRSEMLQKELDILYKQTATKNGDKRLLTVLLAKVVSSVQASNDKISIERLKLETNQNQVLKLTGIGTTSHAIEDFAERLRSEKMFHQVVVDNKFNVEMEGISVKRYVLTCSF